MAATATPTKPKKPPSKLTMYLRDGKQIYCLPKRERDRINAVREFCGELTEVAEMNPEASEANAALAKLLERFAE